MDKKYKLVICDIDGTLVTTDHVLTPKTKETIDKLHEQGTLFGVASGRAIDEVALKARLWGFDYEFDILIGMNGSELRDGFTNTDYEYYLLKTEWIKEIMEMMEQFNTNYFIYKNSTLLCKTVDDNMLTSAKSCKKPVYAAKDDSEFYETENAKIMFRMKEELMPIVEAYLEQHPNPNYKGFKTQSTLIEFADIRISKAYALERFCEMRNISLDEIVAFGDTSNDNEMLKASGLGVCLCNGSDDTKTIADVLTYKSNDDDGFADFVEKHLLNKIKTIQ